MADFSELCPIFDTGVYGEVSFPRVAAVNIATDAFVHWGFCFGRSVIVTAAWVIKAGTGSWATSTIFNLFHATTVSITHGSQTLVASYNFVTSSASQTVGDFLTMNMVGNTTFGTTDIVHTQNEGVVNGGNVAVIIRYKEA